LPPAQEAEAREDVMEIDGFLLALAGFLSIGALATLIAL
jgi:hypothetical protein